MSSEEEDFFREIISKLEASDDAAKRTLKVMGSIGRDIELSRLDSLREAVQSGAVTGRAALIQLTLELRGFQERDEPPPSWLLDCVCGPIEATTIRHEYGSLDDAFGFESITPKRLANLEATMRTGLNLLVKARELEESGGSVDWDALEGEMGVSKGKLQNLYYSDMAKRLPKGLDGLLILYSLAKVGTH